MPPRLTADGLKSHTGGLVRRRGLLPQRRKCPHNRRFGTIFSDDGRPPQNCDAALPGSRLKMMSLMLSLALAAAGTEAPPPAKSAKPKKICEKVQSTGSAVPKLAVPAEAIVLLQNQPTVFLAKGNGPFEPASVMVGDTRDGWTVITQGLKSGDTYVRKGAFALKARLLRSQLGEE